MERRLDRDVHRRRRHRPRRVHVPAVDDVTPLAHDVADFAGSGQRQDLLTLTDAVRAANRRAVARPVIARPEPDLGGTGPEPVSTADAIRDGDGTDVEVVMTVPWTTDWATASVEGLELRVEGGTGLPASGDHGGRPADCSWNVVTTSTARPASTAAAGAWRSMAAAPVARRCSGTPARRGRLVEEERSIGSPPAAALSVRTAPEEREADRAFTGHVGDGLEVSTPCSAEHGDVSVDRPGGHRRRREGDNRRSGRRCSQRLLAAHEHRLSGQGAQGGGAGRAALSISVKQRVVCVDQVPSHSPSHFPARVRHQGVNAAKDRRSAG